MSLMKLTPETVRLRRIAKAYAAGEFTQSEYRAARREVIANFHISAFDDDDTQPRLCPMGPGPVAGECLPPQRRPAWKLGLVAAVLVGLLLVINTALADTGAGLEEYFIGPVMARDPNPATSPRLPVKEVSVADFAPLNGVSPAAVQAVVERSIGELRSRNIAGDHGFTPGELEEIGRFLNALGAHDGVSGLNARDAADLSALVAEQKHRRGLSVVELEEIAQAVQGFYRDAGYFLAVAYVPEQQVRGGIVNLALLPGVLGSVAVTPVDSPVAEHFQDLVGEPLTEEAISTRLYVLNRAAGTHSQAHFEPGERAGETVLNLDVLEQKAWKGAVAIDNYGDRGTGEQRLLATASLLNPTGSGDALNFGLLGTLDGGDQLYGFLEYDTLLGGRHQLKGRVAVTDYSVEHSFQDLATDGRGWLFDVNTTRFQYRDRMRGLSFDVGAGYHRLDWDSEQSAGLIDATQDVLFVSSAINAHRVWDRSRIAGEARLYGHVGMIEGDTFAGQDTGFWDVGLEAFAWRPLDLPLLPGVQKISAEVMAQISGSQLPATRRMVMGGVAGARGFTRDIYLADQGVLLRVDVRTPLALGELSLFADAAYGDTLNDKQSTWSQLTSLGISFESNIAGLASRLSWAVPVASNGTGGLDDDGMQIFWSLRYAR